MANIALIVNNILSDSGAEIGAANGVATLDSGGKIPVSQLPNSVMEFKGTWSAATNTPTLANGTGNAGDVYEVSAAGTVNFGAGGIAFALGDYVVYDGTSWQYSSGQKGTVTSLTFSAPLSGGTITTSGTVSIPAATSSVDGYLKATDWVIFNGKQNALTNPVTGTGTANYLPKFTGASAIGDSAIFNDATGVGIGTTTPTTILTLRKAIDSAAYGSGTRMLDFKSYFAGYDTETVKASIYAGVSSLSTQRTDNGYLAFMTADTGVLYERLRIEKNGNVGIGTTSPSDKLTVEGTHPTNTNYIYFGAGAYNSVRFTKSDNVGTVGGALYLQASNSNNVIVAYGGGNTLIGTATDAGYKLDVNGTGRFSGKTIISASISSDVALDVVNTNTTNGYGLAVRGGVGSTSYALNVVNAANTVDLFKVMGSGAATFSSSVTAGGFIYTTGNMFTGGNNTGIFLTGSTSDYSWGLNRETAGLTLYAGSAVSPKMTITTSGNVGIGTTSPSATFHVVGAAGNQMRYSSPNVSNILGVSSSDVGIVGTVTNHNLALYTNATERMRITSGGNVLIGTTTDSGYKLNVNGTINMGLNQLFTGGGYKMHYRNSTVNITFSGTSNWQINNDADNVALMTVLNGGNVGIGTTSPSNLLSIGANAHTSPDDTNRVLNWYSVGSELWNNVIPTVIGNNNASTSQPQMVGISLFNRSTTANTWSPAITFGGLSTSGAYMNGAAGIAAQLPANSDNNFRGGNLVFYTSGIGAVKGLVEKMRIQHDGNVGIGTTSPFALLHVNGTPDANYGNQVLFDNRTATINYGGVISFAGYKTGTSAANVWAQIAGRNEAGTGTENGYLAFITNTGSTYAERARITSAGNFGVGITDPQQKIQTGGRVRVSPDNSNGGDLGVNDGGLAISTIGASPIQFWTSNYTNERMRITGAGLVAIGNSTPQSNGSSAVLDIGNGSGGTLNLRDTNTGIASEGFHQIYGGDNRMYFYAGGSGASAYMQFYTNDSERMRITSGGNVLIGTSTDAGQKLQVSGGSLFNGSIRMNSNAGGLDLNRGTTSDYVGVSYKSTDVYKWFAGMRENTGTSNYVIYNYTNPADVLTLNVSNNTATFISSVTATSFFESSDKTIKTLIQDNYQTKGIESVTAKLYLKNGKEELGYYAQDLQDILPSAVSKGTDGLLSLSYREVHTAKIARLEKRVEELEQLLNLN